MFVNTESKIEQGVTNVKNKVGTFLTNHNTKKGLFKAGLGNCLPRMQDLHKANTYSAIVGEKAQDMSNYINQYQKYSKSHDYYEKEMARDKKYGQPVYQRVLVRSSQNLNNALKAKRLAGWTYDAARDYNEEKDKLRKGTFLHKLGIIDTLKTTTQCKK